MHSMVERVASQHFHQPRVLFVTTIPLTLTSFLLPFAEHLKAQGAQVDCASLGASTAPGLSTFNNCFDINWSRSLSSLYNTHVINKQLHAIFDQGKYDLVHVHTPIASYLTRRALNTWKNAHKSTHPIVFYTAHGFHFYQGQKSLFKQSVFTYLERYAMRWTDVLITMNEEDERAARKLRGAAARPVIKRIDGVGFDFASYEPLKLAHIERQLSVDDLSDGSEQNTQPFIMTIIAELNENKSHALLFRALDVLKRRGITNWKLYVVGSGQLAEKLNELAHTLNLRTNIIFKGQLNKTDLAEIIRITDMGLLVSKREGLPRSLMELCAGGALIAGTSTRGIRDEVRDPRALALERTPEALATMIDELMHDQPLRISIAQHQYDYARAHFDLEHILAEYDKLYSHYLFG